MSSGIIFARRAAALAMTAAAAMVVPGAATAAGATTQQDFVILLAGSPHYAVYELAHQDELHGGFTPYQLVARAADGTSMTFPVGADQQSIDPGRWSLSKNMLTAVGYPDTSRPADPSTAYWWNLSAGTAGTVTVPAGGFVGADPNGVLYLTSGGYLKEATPAGVTTVLSRPVRYRGSHLIGRSSGRGVVFSDYTGGRGPRARYVRFSHPNKLHKLDTKHSEFVGCGAVSAKYAACTRTGAPEDRARNAALFPLNGGKPIPANDSNEYIGGVALLGAKTLAWTRSHDSGNVGVCCRLATMTRGSHQRHVAKRTVWGGVTWPGIISAYGGVLAMGPERHTILETSDGKTFSTIVTAPSS